MSKIVVVVDMQNDFITGVLGTPGAVKAKEELEKYIDSLNSLEDYVIFTRDSHLKDYKETQEGKNIPEHCIFTTKGWEIPDDLLNLAINKMASHVRLINKYTFGSAHQLKGTIEDIPRYQDSEIIFCGLCTDICVITNALMQKTFFPEIPMSIKVNCCAGTTPEKHEAALKVLESCQFNIIKEG